MQKLKSILSASLLAASFVLCTLAVAKPAEALPSVRGCLDSTRTACKVTYNDGQNSYEGHVTTIEID